MQDPRPPSQNLEEPVNAGFSLWKIEQYLLGELSAAEQDRVTQAAQKDPKLAAYLQRAKGWNEEAKALRLPPIPEAGNAYGPSQTRSWFNQLIDRWQAWGSAISRPVWGHPGLALASLVLLVGVATLTLRHNQGQSNGGSGSESALTPKGTFIPGMNLVHHGQTYASGADIPVHAGDTLRIFYRSVDPLYFQLWCQDPQGSPQALHHDQGESLVASPKWSHSGKSMVIDSQDDCRQLKMFWAASASDLADLEKRFRSGSPLPEEQSAVFEIRFAPKP